VRVVVGDTGFFALPWFKEFIGQEREAVEVTYYGDVFYLDNEDGSGWAKVTNGHGSPQYGHRSLDVERVSPPLSRTDKEEPLSDQSDTWETVKERATLSVHMPSGVVLASIVWDGNPLTAAGATSNAALQALMPQIEALGTPFYPPGPNGELYAR
jgi:hypothetical protein